MTLTSDQALKAAEIRRVLKQTVDMVSRNFQKIRQLGAATGVGAALGSDAAALTSLYASVKSVLHDAAGVDLPDLKLN